MTSAVILILREVLEAMLIVCLLLAASTNLDIAKRWVGFSILLGLLGAGIYTYFFDIISDSFDGVGQEVTNAVMLIAICLFLALYNFFVIGHINTTTSIMPRWAALLSLVGSISFAITREGVEVYLYLSGYIVSPEPQVSVLLGGALGAGIGLSVGALIYFLLKTLSRRTSLYLCCGLLVPVGSGMVSQAATSLMQADLLPTQLPLWDSSSLIPENSIVGELLYALFSYEATPTPLQMEIYLGTLIATLGGMWLSIYFSQEMHKNELKFV